MSSAADDRPGSDLRLPTAEVVRRPHHAILIGVGVGVVLGLAGA